MLYNNSTVEDTTSIMRYERAHRVEVLSPLEGMPQIVFVTSWVERDNVTGQETQKEMHRNLADSFNPNEEFNVYDEEGNPLTTATYEQVAGLLYNLFFHVATKVDG